MSLITACHCLMVQTASAQGPTGGTDFVVPGTNLALVWIPAGSFRMGSDPGEPGHEDDERPTQVKLTHGFWIGQTETTVGQWRDFVAQTRFVGQNAAAGIHVRTEDGWKLIPGRDWSDPGFVQTDSHPVVGVSWEDAVAFCEWISGREGQAGRLPEGWIFRLPSEAQWEYASRAGSKDAFAFGPTLSTDQANFKPGVEGGDFRGGTTPVATFAPNEWGLFDMHGNAWEWCQEAYGEYPTGPLTNPSVVVTGSQKVKRGGSWIGAGENCRSANRNRDLPGHRAYHIGFRIALVRER